MTKICGYNCEHNKGGICQITYCNKIGKITTTTTNDNCEITIYKGSVDTSTGKIILNDIEITDTESWNKAINTLEEKDKEIERLNNIINKLEKYLETEKDNHSNSWHYREWIRQVFDKLKELKEGK